MADTLDVVTLTEAKAALNISGSTHDTELAVYITAASRQLDEYVGPIVNRTITSELHDGGTAFIVPEYRPVSSVTSVTEYVQTTGTALSAESNSAKTASDYLLDGNKIRRRATGSDAWFADGRRNVAVTYVAGRAANTAAADSKFKQSANIMLANLWRKEQGVGSDTFGVGAGVDIFSDPNRFATNIPTFGLPYVVRDLLHGEFLAPKVG